LQQVILPKEAAKIAFFASKHIVRVYPCVLDIDDLEIIDHMFHIESIVRVANRQNRYWALYIDHEKTVLYEGHNTILVEAIDPHTGYSWSQAHVLPKYSENSQAFYSACDNYINRYIEQENVPVIIIAPHADIIDDCKKYLKNYNRLCACVADEQECFTKAQVCIKNNYDYMMHKIKDSNPLVLIDKTQNFEQISQAAIEGRVESLVVSHDFYKTGCDSKKSGKYSIEQNCPLDADLIDIIDEIIETVKAKGGRVILWDSLELERYNNMVAIMRF
jgi:hypothetical protein